jgi:hypothetical protein
MSVRNNKTTMNKELGSRTQKNAVLIKTEMEEDDIIVTCYKSLSHETPGSHDTFRVYRRWVWEGD